MKRKKGNPKLWSVTHIRDDRYPHILVRITELRGTPFLYLGRQVDGKARYEVLKPKVTRVSLGGSTKEQEQRARALAFNAIEQIAKEETAPTAHRSGGPLTLAQLAERYESDGFAGRTESYKRTSYSGCHRRRPSGSPRSTFGNNSQPSPSRSTCGSSRSGLTISWPSCPPRSAPRMRGSSKRAGRSRYRSAAGRSSPSPQTSGSTTSPTSVTRGAARSPCKVGMRRRSAVRGGSASRPHRSCSSPTPTPTGNRPRSADGSQRVRSGSRRRGSRDGPSGWTGSSHSARSSCSPLRAMCTCSPSTVAAATSKSRTPLVGLVRACRGDPFRRLHFLHRSFPEREAAQC